MAKKINLYKMYTGGIILGEVDSESDGKVVLSNPRIVAPQMTMQGYALVLTEVVPYKVLTTRKVDSITLNLDQVMAVVKEEDIVGGLIDEYRSDVSGIDIVSGVNADVFKKDPPKNGGIII